MINVGLSSSFASIFLTLHFLCTSRSENVRSAARQASLTKRRRRRLTCIELDQIFQVISVLMILELGRQFGKLKFSRDYQ